MICLDTISTFENVILTNKNPKEKYEKNYQYTNKSVLKELESYSEELNKTNEILVAQAIIAYFNKLDEELSDKRIHDIKFAKYQLFSLEEMIKNMGLEKC